MGGVGSFYGRFGKRVFDIFFVIALLAVLWPLMLVIAFLIRLTSRGPALFVQERLGRNATRFQLYKFRTMTNKLRVADTLYFSGDSSEITRIGRFLRRTKLDELPQFINVLKGEMSCVGPRPQLVKQLAEFDDNGLQRLRVLPGLTGLAQMHGNVALTWRERWYYDALYVRTMSLRKDLWIIMRTVSVIARGEEKFLRHPPLSGEATNGE